MSQRTISVESNLEHTDAEPSWAKGDLTEENDDRSYSRRRSLECSSIEIQIVDTEPTQHHTDYIIRISCDKQLKRLFPSLPLPTLPPKRYLRSSSDPEIVDQRKEQLEEYLNGLVKIPQVWIKNDFVMFLNDKSNLMVFIWNFERIRRLQDMLKSTKMENESSTAQLNLDLEQARTQVKDLQDRLSHMEMIFLQQALGVAGEQLPTSVIRSISYSDNALSRNLVKELTEEAAALYSENATQSVIQSSDRDLPLSIEDPDSGEPLPAVSLMKALNLAQTVEKDSTNTYSTQSPDDARTIAVSREFKEAIRLSNEILFAVDSPKSRSELDLAKLAASPSVSTSVAETSLHSYNPNDANQSLAAWVKTVVNCSNRMVEAIQPSHESIEIRHRVFSYVRELVARTLGVQLFPVGSFVTHTFLPDGDVGATAFVPKLTDDSWFVKINEALCLAAFQGNKSSDDDKELSVGNVSFVNTEIKMIRCMISGISVDISTNQLPSLFADMLIERVDEFVGHKHVFKRALMLVKAWFCYESPRFTQGGGGLFNSRETKLDSWTIAVMMIWTFNSRGKDIFTPLQALSHFLQIFNQFDWANYAMTVVGPVSLENPSQSPVKSSENYLPPSLFDFSIVDDPRFAKASGSGRPRDRNTESTDNLDLASSMDDFTEEVPQNPSPSHHSHHHANVEAPSKGFQRGFLNILDPFDDAKNLLEGVESGGCDLILSALRGAYQAFQEFCEESSKLLGFGQFSTQKIMDDVEKLTKTFFLNTSQKFLVSSDALEETAEDDEQRLDIWQINKSDLQFALSYGRMTLGGKIDLELLTQLVLIILEKKGAMPVGEIGKNLQALLGCDSLSKRLKEQFSGLKRAIENSNSSRIKMGSEHPFNPVVSLVSVEDHKINTNSVPTEIPFSFHHADYLFVPYNYQLQMQSAALKESQAIQSNRQNRYYYRRPPPVLPVLPVLMDTQSMISQASSLTSSNGEISPEHMQYRRGHNYRPKLPYPASPNRPYYRQSPNPNMSHQNNMYPPMGMDMTGIPIPAPAGYGYPPVPMFPPPLYGPPPPFYPAQLHNSLSSSVSSSYGQTSPMSQSPMTPSYMLGPAMNNNEYPPAMNNVHSHSPHSPMNRNRQQETGP